MPIEILAKGRNGRVVTIDTENLLATPQIFEEGDIEVGKVKLYKDESGEYRVVVNIKEDISTGNTKSIKLIKSDRKPSEEENGIYVDPACFSGTTIIDIEELENIPENIVICDLDGSEIPDGEVSLKISQLIAMIDDKKIEDPLVQIAIYRIIQKLRETGYTYQMDEYIYEPSIHLVPHVEQDELELTITKEGQDILEAKIDELNNKLNDENIVLSETDRKNYEDIRAKLEMFMEEGFAILSGFAASHANGALREKEDVVATIAIDKDGNVTYVTQLRGGARGLSPEVPAGRVVLKEIAILAVGKDQAEKLSLEEQRIVALEYIANKKGVSLDELTEEKKQELLEQFVAEKELSEEAGLEGRIVKIGKYNTPDTCHKDGNGASRTSIYLALGTVSTKYLDEGGEVGEITGKFSVPFLSFLELIQKGKIRDTNSIIATYQTLELFERIVENPDLYRDEFDDSTIELANRIINEIKEKSESLLKKKNDEISSLSPEYRAKWDKLTIFQRTRATSMFRWSDQLSMEEAIEIAGQAEDYISAYKDMGRSFTVGLNTLMKRISLEEDEKTQMKSFVGIKDEENVSRIEDLSDEIKRKIRERINEENVYDIILDCLSDIHHDWVLDWSSPKRLAEQRKVLNYKRGERLYQVSPYELLGIYESNNDMVFIEDNLVFIKQVLEGLGVSFNEKKLNAKFLERQARFLAQKGIANEGDLARYYTSVEMENYLKEEGRDAVTPDGERVIDVLRENPYAIIQYKGKGEVEVKVLDEVVDQSVKTQIGGIENLALQYERGLDDKQRTDMVIFANYIGYMSKKVLQRLEVGVLKI